MEKKIERKPGWHDPEKVKITHVMADGTVRDSIEGIEIPDSPALREFIRLARLIAKAS